MNGLDGRNLGVTATGVIGNQLPASWEQKARTFSDWLVAPLGGPVQDWTWQGSGVLSALVGFGFNIHYQWSWTDKTWLEPPDIRGSHACWLRFVFFFFFSAQGFYRTSRGNWESLCSVRT